MAKKKKEPRVVSNTDELLDNPDTTVPSSAGDVPESVAAPKDNESKKSQCPECKGEGLQNQFTLCPKCGGTGKV